jgi:hypothetical protein
LAVDKSKKRKLSTGYAQWQKNNGKSYPQLINRVMHCGVYATPQSYPQLIHSLST